MSFQRPFFRGGKLVRQEVISKFKAAGMEQASSWRAVDSSNVAYICWRDDDRDGEKYGLGVKFKSGMVYWYPSAPYSIFEEMLASSSKGTYLNEVVKPSYPHDGPYPSG